MTKENPPKKFGSRWRLIVERSGFTLEAGYAATTGQWCYMITQRDEDGFKTVVDIMAHIDGPKAGYYIALRLMRDEAWTAERRRYDERIRERREIETERMKRHSV